MFDNGPAGRSDLPGHRGPADRPVAGGSAAAAESGRVTASESGDVAAGDDLAAWLARLAAIWAMVAEADPELARRVRGYLAAPE